MTEGKEKDFDIIASETGDAWRHWIAYTLSEGGEFHMLGLFNRETLDEYVKRFEEEGRIEDPNGYRKSRNPREPVYIEIASLMVLTSSMMYHKVPKPPKALDAE